MNALVYASNAATTAARVCRSVIGAEAVVATTVVGGGVATVVVVVVEVVEVVELEVGGGAVVVVVAAVVEGAEVVVGAGVDALELHAASTSAPASNKAFHPLTRNLPTAVCTRPTGMRNPEVGQL